MKKIFNVGDRVTIINNNETEQLFFEDHPYIRSRKFRVVETKYKSPVACLIENDTDSCVKFKVTVWNRHLKKS